jgi:hypothetical protein
MFPETSEFHTTSTSCQRYKKKAELDFKLMQDKQKYVFLLVALLLSYDMFRPYKMVINR